MEKTLLKDELSDEQLRIIEGGNPAENARINQMKRYEQIKKELELRQTLETKPILDEDELTDEQLEGIKAGRPRL